MNLPVGGAQSRDDGQGKLGRRGIGGGGVGDPGALEQGVGDKVAAGNRLVHDSAMDWKPVLAQLLEHAARLRPWVRDISLLLNQAMGAGQSMLFEGAQGT